MGRLNVVVLGFKSNTKDVDLGIAYFWLISLAEREIVSLFVCRPEEIYVFIFNGNLTSIQFYV